MPTEIDLQRLEGLLDDPREDLDCEIKGWLDLKDSNDEKAVLAKAVIAMANHGGGYVILGLTEKRDTGEFLEAERRPSNWDGYSQDRINGIVRSYCEPDFQCSVHFVRAPGGALPKGAPFPIVVVPGGHRVPIQARRGAPNQRVSGKAPDAPFSRNEVYVRTQGPSSERPQSFKDWDDLLQRCLQNRRDEFFEGIRDLLAGTVRQAVETSAPDRLNSWIEANFQRWQTLVKDLGELDGPRFAHGHYCFAYEILGDLNAVGDDRRFRDILQSSTVRHTGWPPFWCPTREGITPYPYDEAVECWLGNDPMSSSKDCTPDHSDFWRVRKDGMAFLLRGYQEDSGLMSRSRGEALEPGTAFDVILPIWRVGETLLHARSLAENLFDGPTTIRFVAIYSGLSERSLVSVIPARIAPFDEHVSHQAEIKLSTHVEANAIDSNLPEIVHPLLDSLYSLFDFYELSMSLVVNELARMRSRRF